MIKIVIADDHKIVLEGIISLIKSEDEIEVVGEAKNGREVLHILDEKEVDIVVLDIEMPEMNGIETTKMIRKIFPHVKILILTMHDRSSFVRKIIESGAQGYILKNKGKEELVSAIRTIYEGEDYYGREVTKILISGMRTPKVFGEIKLTNREIEVLKYIVNGYSTPVIAKKLDISPHTVETYRRNLIEKTGSRNAVELAKFAVENGYS